MSSDDLVGKRVEKFNLRGKATKPFKSGLKINTVKGLTTNPYTNKPGFCFKEDDSIVDCEKCREVEENV